MTLFVTFLSQAIILHRVSPDTRAHQHLSQKRSRLKTRSLAVIFQTSSLSEETKVMPRQGIRGVCVRMKTVSSFQEKWLTIAVFHSYSVLAAVRDWILVPSFANLFYISITGSAKQYF